MLSYTTAAVTPAEATAYVAARSLQGWPDTEAARLAALRRGQDYIAREYNGRWAVAFDDATAPEAVRIAIIEAALVEARSPGALAPVVKASDAKMLTGVGSITWSRVPGPGGVEALRPRLLHVEALLRRLIADAGRYLERA